MPDLKQYETAPTYDYDVVIPGVLSDEQRDQLRREAEAKQKATADEVEKSGQAWQLANELENSTWALDRAAHAPEFEADPAYQVTKEMMNDVLKDVPDHQKDDYHHMARTSYSEAEFQHRAKEYKRLADAEEKLSSLGWSGVGLRLGATLADPANWAIGLATGPLGAALTAGGRIARIGKMAGMAAIENAALEAAISGTNEARSPDDMLWSILGGAGFGGAIGSLSSRLFTQAEKEALQKLAKQAQGNLDINAAARHLPPEKAAAVRAGIEADAKVEPLVGKETPKAAPKEAPHVTLQERVKQEAPVEDHVAPLREKAAEARQMLELTSRSLKRDEAVLEHLKRLQGETRKLDDGVSVTVRKKGATVDVPPEVKAALKRYVDEDGVPIKGEHLLLQESVEAMRKEVKLLKTRADTYEGLAKARTTKAEAEAPAKAGAPAPEADHKSAGSAAVAQERLREDMLNQEAVDTALRHEMDAAPKTKYAKWRFDIMSRLKSSENPMVRWIGARMAEDPVANMTGEALEIGASEISALVHRLAEVAFYKAATPAYNKWLTANGHGLMAKLAKRREFFEEVTKAVRSGSKHADENVEAAAEAMRNVFEQFGERARNARLEGFEDFTPNPKYMPRIHNSEAVTLHDTNFGTPQMRKFIAGAIRSANANLSEDALEKLSRGYWNRVRRLAAGTDINNMGNRVSLDNRELIREILQEGNLSKSEIEHVMTEVERTVGKDKEPKLARAKSRQLLDEEFSAELTHGANSSEGSGKTQTVHIADLYENNAEKLFQMYSRSMSGHIALAEKFTRLLEPGESFSRRVFDRWISRAKEYAADLGLDTKSTDKDVRRLNFLWDAVTGVPLENDPKSLFSRVSRRIRDYNFIRVMNQVGFAQIAEMGNIIGMGGTRNLLRQLPEFKAMLTRAQNGELESDLARELEGILGIGTEWIRHATVSHWDNADYIHANKLGKADAALDVGKRFTAVASGMLPVNIVLQRLSGMALAQRLASVARGIETMNPARLRSLGFNDAMRDRVFKMLREKSTWDGNTLKSINIDQWDQEVASAFTYAMFRGSRRIIQENDVGAMAEMMHGALAKTIIQFRSFAINAWSKQTLHNIAHADMQTFIAWSMSMMFGGMAYIAQTHLNSIGREDRKEYLKKRLDLKNLALAAFQRAGASSLLPMPIDSVWQLYSDESMFNGRTTQLSTSLAAGIPTVQLGQSAYSALQGIIKAPLRSDYDYSKRDFRADWTLAGFQNLLPAVWVQNKLAQQFPDFSTDR